VTTIDGVQVRDCGTIDSTYSGLLRDCPLDMIQVPDADADAGCTSAGSGHGGVIVVAAALIVRRRRRAR